MSKPKNKDPRKASIAGTLSIFIIVAIMGIMFGLTRMEIPSDNKDLFNMGFGSILTWGGAAVHYFLGSSKGSKDKDAMLEAELAQDADR